MGYNPSFITGCKVPLPTLVERSRESAFLNGKPIHHTRFSILFNEELGFAIATAHNIDGTSIIPKGIIERRDRFRFDPDVPRQLQVDNERGYLNNPWDRGHLVRRRALHWGEKAIAERADSESFFWTNIAPQHHRLHDTTWGQIEDWILDFTDENDKKVSVFTGPVLTPDDMKHQNLPNERPNYHPAGFWKILVLKHEGELCAAAFLVWQRDFNQMTPIEFDPVLEQVRITTIEFLSGLSFEYLREADPLRFGGVQFDAEDRYRMIAERRRSQTNSITCQEDIFM